MEFEEIVDYFRQMMAAGRLVMPSKKSGCSDFEICLF